MKHVFKKIVAVLILLTLGLGITLEQLSPKIVVEKVSLDRTSATIFVNEQLELHAVVDPSDASNPEVTWSTSNPSVASVDENGLVTGLADGTTNITVTTDDRGLQATCKVRVVFVPVDGITLDKEDEFLYTGESIKLNALINPDNSTVKSYTWSTSNDDVITVDDEGNVLAVGPGSATVTVTTDNLGKTDTCKFTVKDKADSLIIYEVYGGGGNAGSIYSNDYVVLYNPLDEAVNINGYSLQYAAKKGEFYTSNLLPLAGVIESEEYFLVQLSKGNTETGELPVVPSFVGAISMGAKEFKLALVDNIEPISGSDDTDVIDFVGVGGANNYEGAVVPTLSNETSARRHAFYDEDNNSTDFAVVTPDLSYLNADNISIGASITKVDVLGSVEKVVFELNSNEKLDLSDLTYEITYSNNYKVQLPVDTYGLVIANRVSVSKLDIKSVGKQEISIKWGNEVIHSFDVTVFDEELFSIELKEQPSKVSYFEGEEFTFDGVVEATYRFDGKVVLDSDDYTISAINMDVPANDVVVTISHTFKGVTKTTSYTIDIIKIIETGIVWNEEPSETVTTLYYDYEFFVDGSIKVNYNNGDTKVVTLTKDMVSGYDLQTLGEQTLTVTYHAPIVNADFTITYEVEVVDSPEHPVLVESIALDKTGSVSLYPNNSFTLKTTVTPSNATFRQVTWTSSNPNVASVDNGVVTTHAYGTATITASVGRDTNVKTATYTVNVNQYATEIEMDDITVYVDDTVDVEVEVLPQYTTNKEYKLELNEGASNYVALIKNQDGSYSLTGIKASADVTILLTATALDGSNVTKEVEVTVKQYAEELQIENITLYTGDTKDLEVKVLPNDTSDKSYELVLSNNGSTYATLTKKQDGTYSLTGVKANGTNNVTITAKTLDGSNLSKVITVTVLQHATDLVVSSDDINEEMARKALEGKYVSIVGDSISTYQGYNNNTNYNSTIGSNAVYYNSSRLADVNDTWWLSTINELEMELLVNNSWSGSTVSTFHGNTSAGCMTRSANLHNDHTGVQPDIIVIYLGINDLYHGATLGEFTSLEEIYDESTKTYIGNVIEFSDAYATMIHKIINNYPEAEVYCCTLPNYPKAQLPAWNETITYVADYFDVNLVDFYNDSTISSSTLSSLMIDGIHPNKAGMKVMKDCVVEAIINTQDEINDELIIYTNEEVELDVVVNPLDTTNKNYEITTSNTTNISLTKDNGKYLVKGLKATTEPVTLKIATLDGSNVTKEIKVTVKQYATSIEMSDITLYTGDTVDVPVVVGPSDVTLKGYTLTLSEGANEFVTLNADNTLTGVKANGTTSVKLTATSLDGKVTKTINVTVKQYATSISAEDIIVYTGEKEEVVVTINPADTTNKDYEITTTNETNIALVKENGTYYVEGLKACKEPVSLLVKALDGSNVTKEIKVTVKQYATSITMSDLNIYNGESLTITNEVVVGPEDVTDGSYVLSASKDSIDYTGGNYTIEYVDGSYTINVFVAGNYPIYAHTQDGSGLVAKAIVHGLRYVTDIEAEDVSVNVGSAQSFSYNVLPWNASNKEVEFEFSDNYEEYVVPHFSSNGRLYKLEGLKATNGEEVTVTIKATDGSGVSKTVKITIIQLAEEITGIEDSYEVLNNDTLQLNPVVLPVDTTDKSVTYKVEDETIATVSEDGLVTAHKVGETKITITSNSTSSVTKEVLIKVLKSVEVNSYVLVTDVNELKAGDTIVIAAKDSDVALSTEQRPNNRGETVVTKDNNELIVNSNVQIITLENGILDDTFAFNVGDGYLYAAGGANKNNYLRVESQLSGNSSWKIEIGENGKATITAQGDAIRNILRYNANSSLFSCYASGQKDIVIYKYATVNKLGATGIEITNKPANDIVEVGGSFDLSAIVTPSNAYTELEWSTNNTNIEVDSKSGHVETLSNGQATVLVTDKKTNISTSYTFTIVTYVNEFDVIINNQYYEANDTIDMMVADEFAVIVVPKPYTASNKEYDITLEANDYVKLVDGKLVATKVMPENSEVVLTITSKDSKAYSESFNIKVNSTFIHANDVEIYPGESKGLTILVYPLDASYEVVVPQEYDSNLDVVNTNGSWSLVAVNVIPGNEYYVTVVAYDGTTYDVNVKALVAVTSVDIQLENESIDSVTIFEGDTLSLSTKVLPENASNKDVTYEVAGKSIASIDQNGLLTGIKNGSTQVIVTSNYSDTIQDIIEVTVIKPVIGYKYQLVTDVNDLAAGDTIVIAAKDSDVAMSTTQTDKYRGQVNITKESNELIINSNVQIITLEDGGNGTFRLNVGGLYLAAVSSSSNNLKTVTTIDDNSKWNIKIENGLTYITSVGSYTRNNIRHNPSYTRFSCYAYDSTSSSIFDIAIYKAVESKFVSVDNIIVDQEPTLTIEQNKEYVFDGVVSVVFNDETRNIIDINNNNYGVSVSTIDTSTLGNKTLNIMLNNITMKTYTVVVTYPLPEANTELTIEKALEVASHMGYNGYTSDKYYVSGTIKSVSNITHGNMNIEDENGNSIYVYGTYSSDGKTRYDAMTEKPIAGYKVKLYGVLGNYKGSPQMKDGWIISFEAPEVEEPEYQLPEADTLITIEKAIEICEKVGSQTTDSWYIQGKITKIDTAYNSTYGNISVTIQDETAAIKVFRLSGDGVENLAVGDTIKVYGQLLYYNGTIPEMAEDCILVSDANSFSLSESSVYLDSNETFDLSEVLDFYHGATISDLSFTTSNENVATVSNTGIITAGSLPNTPAIVYITLGNSTKEFTVTVNDIVPVEKEYSYIFEASKYSAVGTKTLNGVDWNLDNNGGYYGYDGTKGQQIGSGSKPATTLTFKTVNSVSNVKVIKINTSGAKSTNATLKVYVGDTQVGNDIKLTTTATEYTIDVSNLSGNIKFVYTQTSKKAIYIKSISYTYVE